MNHNIFHLAAARPRGNGLPRPVPAKDLPDPIELLREEVIRRAAEQDEFDRDLRIIGWGLVFAYAWIVAFRIAQMGGVL